MTTEAVKQVILRAVAEPEFRQLLFRQPDQALTGYPLTGDEHAALLGMIPESFNALTADIESRISRATAKDLGGLGFGGAIKDLTSVFKEIGGLTGGEGGSAG